MAFNPISSVTNRANNIYNRFSNNMGVVMAESRTARAFKTYLRSDVHRTGMRWTKEILGFGELKGPLRLLGPAAFLGMAAISGYQKEGLSGAAKGVAGELAFNYALGSAMGAIGGVLPGIAAVAGAGGLALGMDMINKGESPLEYFSKPYVNEYMKKRARLEMGAPIHDPFGNIATMRQRSLNAIQNSRINGRSALGNEAALLYRPFYR